MEQFITGNGGIIGIALLIGLIILIISRQILTWFWKINEIISLLDEIAQTLQEIKENNIEAVKRKIDEASHGKG